MAGDLPFVFPRATVLVRKKQSVCVCASLSLALSLPQLAPLCGLLFWSFMRTLLLLLLVFLFTSSAHFVARLAGLLSPASSPFGAIVLVKLTICIQLRYALCPAADEARLSAQKYAQDTHSDSSPFPLSLSFPFLRSLCICGLIYFHLLCHNNLYSFFFRLATNAFTIFVPLYSNLLLFLLAT